MLKINMDNNEDYNYNKINCGHIDDDTLNRIKVIMIQ